MCDSSREKFFSSIFIQYYDYIFQLALIDVKNQEGARDVSQEVFTRFIPVMDSVRSVKNWLIGTEKKVVMEYHRMWRLTDESIPETITDVRETNEKSMREWGFIAEDLEDDQSIFHDKKDLELFYSLAVEKKSIRSVGYSLNISENQVKYRYRMIRKRLQINLRDKGLCSIEDILD